MKVYSDKYPTYRASRERVCSPLSLNSFSQAGSSRCCTTLRHWSACMRKALDGTPALPNSDGPLLTVCTVVCTSLAVPYCSIASCSYVVLHLQYINLNNRCMKLGNRSYGRERNISCRSTLPSVSWVGAWNLINVCGWQRRHRALTANNRCFYWAGQEKDPKNTGLDIVKCRFNCSNINCRGSRGENRSLMFLSCVGEDFTEEIDDLDPTCVLGRV